MLPSHSKAAPDSIYIDSCEVDVVTLDSVFNDYVTNKEKVYIKIDTQGFEADVLKGMENCLQQVSVVQIELSIVPLYEGQELYSFFFDYLTAAGFNLWSIIPGFSDKEIGRLLQFDAIFIRDD
jgi:hypothetical protein